MGWCFFETAVASVGSASVRTIKDGEHDTYRVVSPVPMPPAEFEEVVRKKHFTSKNTDVEVVIDLYKRIWPTLVRKDTNLQVYNWGDNEAERFLAVLHVFKLVPSMDFVMNKFSAAMKAKIS